jgi:hypothetical protein
VIPIVIWIVVGVVSLLAGTSIAVKWDAIIIALKGKRLAVLGARMVGKTCLIKFLTSGSIPAEYRMTNVAEKNPGRRFSLQDLDLKIKDIVDVAGEKESYAEWKKEFDQSDIVFYLLRADRLLDGDKSVEERVRNDLKHVERWLEKRRVSLFIIGTHCDLHPGFFTITPETMGDYVDTFKKLPTIGELVARGGGSQQVKVVIGSMKTITDTEALVYQIFMQVNA